MLALYDIADFLHATTWALTRVVGLVLVAPLLGAVFVPVRVRVLIAIVLAVAMLPAIPALPSFPAFSVMGFLAVIKEVMIGVSIGFALKLVMEAAVFAGQVISTGMGLAFAIVVDPQAGNMPLLGRFYIIVATLLMLAVDAHLVLISLLADSYSVMPVGESSIMPEQARALALFGSTIFTGAMYLSLPAVIAILMVNVAFGVISRAAPTLNLFAVGFPISLMLGFVVMVISVRGQGPVWEAQFNAAMTMAGQLLGGG